MVPSGPTSGLYRPLYLKPLPRSVSCVNFKLLHLAAFAVAATRAVHLIGAPPPANPARDYSLIPADPQMGCDPIPLPIPLPKVDYAPKKLHISQIQTSLHL